jgi:hypothetical protein
MGEQLIRDHAGVRSYESYDDASDTLIIRHESDMKAAVDYCRSLANDDTGRCNDGLQKVASVPVPVQYEWLAKFGVRMWDPNHKAAVNRLLDGEYRYLKTKDIILG